MRRGEKQKKKKKGGPGSRKVRGLGFPSVER
jgi:hypothetical protein